MKTVFYKKILPLALVASLAMSGFTGAYSVSAAKAAEPAPVVSVVDDVPVVGLSSESIKSYDVPDPVEFDYLDGETAESELTLTFLCKENLSGVTLSITGNDAEKPIDGIKVKSVTKGDAETVEENGEQVPTGFYTYTLKATVKGSVQTTEGLRLSDGKDLLSGGNTKFKLKVDRVAKTGKTQIAEKAISYKDTKTVMSVLDLSNVPSGDVNAIADNGFEGVKAERIILPSYITKIGANAFKGCPNLSIVEVGANSMAIPDNAFTGCKQVLIFGANEVTFNSKNDANLAKTAVKVGSLETGTVDQNKLILGQKDELLIDVHSNRIHNLKTGKVIGKLTKTEAWNTYTNTPEKRKKIKWAVYQLSDKENKKASTAGKFKKGAGYSAANIKGDFDKIALGGLKPNGAFNSSGEVRAIYEEKVDGKNVSTVLATFQIYVVPEYVSTIVTTSDSSKWTKDNQYALSGDNGEYTLKINEGSSFTLPFKANNGQDKTLEYHLRGVDNDTPASGFTVTSKGAVKALAGAAGSKGVIEISTQDAIGRQGEDPADAPHITVNVEVLPTVKAIRTNTTSVGLVPGESQRFTISGNPATNGEIEATFEVPTGYNLTIGRKIINGGKSEKVKFTGVTECEVSLDDKAVEKAAKDSKSGIVAGGKINISGTATGNKTFKATVSVSQNKTSIYDNVKSIKATGKLDKTTNTINLNVPLGTLYNLGVSVLPVSADTDFNWETAKKGNDVINSTDLSKYIKGDVFKAIEEGTYTFQAKTHGKDASGNEVLSSKYVINVYNQGGGFRWADKSYVLRGGFLVTNDDETNKAAKVNASNGYIEINEPEFTGVKGADTVTWTSNNPSGLLVYPKDGKLVIMPLIGGTYTVTGTSAISKQKYSFKVMAEANMTDEATNDYTPKMFTVDQYNDQNATDGEISFIEGNTMQAYVNLTDKKLVGSKITWSSDSKDITVKNGLISAKKAGKANIKAVIEPIKGNSKKIEVTAKVRVTATASTTQLVVPATGISDANIRGISATFYNPGKHGVSWYYVTEENKNNQGKQEKISNIKNFSLKESGKYYIYPEFYSDNSLLIDSNGFNIKKEITIYGTAASKVTALNAEEYTIAELKGDIKNGQGIGIKKEGSTDAVTVRIPIAIADKDNSLLTGDDIGTIAWTSSNVYIANATDDPKADSDTRTDCNRYVIVTLDKKNYGKVTLTGVTSNSGKKVSIVINSVNADTSKKTITIPGDEITALTASGSSLNWKANEDADKTFTITGTVSATYASEHIYSMIDKSKFSIVGSENKPISGLTVSSVSWKGTYKAGYTRQFEVKVSAAKDRLLSGKDMEMKLKIENDREVAGTPKKMTYSVAKVVKSTELVMTPSQIKFKDKFVKVDFVDDKETKDITITCTYDNSESDDIGSKSTISTKDVSLVRADGLKLAAEIKEIKWVNAKSYTGGAREFTIKATLTKDGCDIAEDSSIDPKFIQVKVDSAVSTEKLIYVCTKPAAPAGE